MSDEHLDELQRKRAALQAQLDALDQEAALAATPAAPTPAAESPAYEPDPEGAGRQAKQGCLLSFALFIILMIAAMVLIYFWRYRDRPLLLAPRPTTSQFRSIRSA